MDYPKPTHEIWIEIDDTESALYGEALIGIVYTDAEGVLHPKFTALPVPGTRVTMKPAVD